jgi:hypothetical protein
LGGFQAISLSPLANLKNLEELDFSGNLESDLSPLSNLTNLRILNLEFRESQAIDLSPLTSLKNLEGLYIRKNLVKDLTPISELGNLRWLRIYATDPSLSTIPPVPLHGVWRSYDLQLDLHGENLSDISPISKLTLSSLSIVNTEVSNLSPLSNLTRLQVLHITNYEGPDYPNGHVRDLSPLAYHPGLRSVSLWGTPATDYTPLLTLNPECNIDMYNVGNEHLGKFRRFTIASALANRDTIMPLFVQANETIMALKLKTEAMMNYARAEKACQYLNYESARMYLELVLDKAADITEPMYLPILGLILVPVLLSRQ